MDKICSIFLNTLQAALTGKTPEGCRDVTCPEWDQVLALAQSHHVLPLVFEAACRLPEVKNDPHFAPVGQQVRRQVLTQMQKTDAFLSLLPQLQAAGVQPLVVKGLICRELYVYPDHRISSDEDVLIDPDAFPPCHHVLEAFGMTAGDHSEDDYEIPYHQAAGPLFIELHRQLFPPDSEAYGHWNRFFEGAAHRAVTHNIQGVPVCSLGHTDHLLYLICHAFKHFLHSGFGIRQVCDICLYADRYGSAIDWDIVMDRCRAIRAQLFAAAVFRVGEKHLGFDPGKACYPASWQDMSVDETALLEDLLSGGVYGNASMDRVHSSNITLDAVSARNQGRSGSRGLLVSLFPSAKKLSSRYPYLKKHPWLLPVAWCSRAFRYSRESRAGSAGEALRIGNQRVALLKQYGVIE